jgi:hypothetical protein
MTGKKNAVKTGLTAATKPAGGVMSGKRYEIIGADSSVVWI